MRNSFLNTLNDLTNYTLTENRAVTHKTTKSDVLDMFALCGAYRNRTDEDCITAFMNAYSENPVLALKCLFYLGDCRGGQGERRFFRVCFKWLCNADPDAARRNLKYIPEYRRWDDVIYSTLGTKVENDALEFIKNQLILDMDSVLVDKAPSLLGKWLPSENASSTKTRAAAHKIREYLDMTHKQYRKTLSKLRSKINIVEKLMSENRWDEIEFDKIPSKAGLIYKNAFARRDIIAKKYETFAKDKTTKVNAEVLNPVDIAKKAFNYNYNSSSEDVERLMLQKYWDNLKDYYNGRKENGLAIVDTSGSMYGTPLTAAVSMGAYIAERGHGPFANHFITFSDHPELIRFEGVDITDKFNRAIRADWGNSTNIEAVFNLLLETAKAQNTAPEDIPERLYIFSDMEFNGCISHGPRREGISFGYYANRLCGENAAEQVETLLEKIEKDWIAAGYQLPKVIFWNLDARQNNIPALGGRFSYVSGFSLAMMEQILSGEDGYSLMLKVLNGPRYELVK